MEDQLNFEAEQGQSSKREGDEESADNEDEEKREDFEPVDDGRDDDEDEQGEEEVKEFQPLTNGRVQVGSLLIELI